MNLGSVQDLDWPEVKYCFKRQLSKCVNECKAQASYAKKLVHRVKRHISSHSSTDLHKTAKDISDGEDECGWDTDFDSDEEEPVANDSEDQVVCTNICVNGDYADQAASLDISQDMDKENGNDLSNRLSFNGNSEPTSIMDERVESPPLPVSLPPPRPPEKPAIPKPPLIKPNMIPRAPLTYKRPSVLPPPPPVATPSPVSSPQAGKNAEQEEEEYLIPIGFSPSTRSQSLSCIYPKIPTPATISNTPTPHLSLSHDNESESSPDLYEVINSLPEENYETIADCPLNQNSNLLARSSSLNALPVARPDQPSLPPRSKQVAGNSPPPLPEKPRKILEAVSSLDSSVKPLNISSHEKADSSAAVLDRPSLPLPKNTATGDPQPMSRSSSTSSISSSSSATPGMIRKRTPPMRLGFQNYEDTNVDVANRPLPPLPPPLPMQGQVPLQEETLLHWPWFHDIERDKASLELLNMAEEGAYVVRPSKRAGKSNPYTLTILHESKIFHLNIRQRPDGRYALGKEKEREKSFDSVVQLITFHQSEPILLTAQKKQAGKTCLRVHLQKNVCNN